MSVTNDTLGICALGEPEQSGVSYTATVASPPPQDVTVWPLMHSLGAALNAGPAAEEEQSTCEYIVWVNVPFAAHPIVKAG